MKKFFGEVLFFLFIALIAGICFLPIIIMVGVYTDSKGTVDYVIDGDTIVLTDGRIIRYIGIDTPEKGECYYSEAREFNDTLVRGEKVTLEKDKTNKDKYGRLLKYVYVNGVDVNSELLRAGYATVFEVAPNTKKSSKFKIMEELAKEKGRDLHTWCDTKTIIIYQNK